MRIGIDARMFGSEQTGIGIYIQNLIREIADSDRKNEYRIFLTEPAYSRFPYGNERIKRVKVSSRWYGWKEQIVLPWQFFKERVDVMHFPHFNAPIFYSAPSVVTIHDLTPKYFPGHKIGASRYRRLAFEMVLSGALKKAKKIIAVSEYTKNDIVRHYPHAAPKIKVIYEGVPFRRAGDDGQNHAQWGQKEIQTLKSRHSIEKPFIFYTGVWRNHKNLTGLIRAFDLLVNKYRVDAELVLGGNEDPYYPETRREWERLGLASRVITPGFISDEELPLFYRAAEVFVIPSFAEGFGFVGLEAMSAGTCVASSCAGSLPEILGDAALYFDPHNHQEMADVIVKAFSDPDARARLKEKGLEQVKKYSWRKMAEETVRIYQEAAEM